MTKDYTSIYTIEDFFINEIGAKYFDVDDLSLERVGLIGMINDIAASTTEDQFEAMSKYLNETNVATANLPDFIYGYAANYGITDIFASPAIMPMILFVKESDIIKNMKSAGNHYEFIIDSDMKIYVDNNDLIYSVPYDIVIRTTQYKGEYSHIAAYDMSYHNDIADLNTPYLKIIRQKIDGEMWLAIRLDVYQYERKKYSEPIITNNKLNIPYVEITFENHLCNFEVFYQAVDGDITQLTKKMETMPATVEPFVYFKMIDDNTIRFSFANDDRYFVPDYNSTLHIHMYETSGELGNFSWSVENLEVNPAPQTDNEDIAYNRSIFLDGAVLSSSKGGLNQYSVDDVRLMTLERMITVDSYTSDTDLNIHFLNFGTINNTSAIFVKQRDDIAGRIYGCYTRIGDGTDIYPTNTLDLRLKTEDVDERFDNLYQFILKPGTRFGYEDDTTLTTIKVLKDEDPIQDIEYMNMCLMVVSLRANSVRLYMTSIDKNVILEYSYMNGDSVFNFLAGNCRIYRNALKGEDRYKITMDITRVDGIESVTTGGITTPYEVDPSKIKVLLVFQTAAGHYVPMSLTGYDETNLIYHYETYLETDDMIDDSRISITNLLLRESGEIDGRIVDMMNPNISVAIFYDYGDGGMGHDYTDISEVSAATLCNIYTPETNEFYLAYPLSLMRSHVIFEDNPDSVDGYNFLIKQLPVVGKEFLEDNTNAKKIFEAVVDQHQYLSETVQKITENFTIVIKFYNTYGRSRLFYLYDAETLLNHVNSTIELRICFNEGVIVEDYLPKIRIHIKEFVESINNKNELDTGVNAIHVSKLLCSLHDNFEQIKYAEFVSINGYPSDVQTIQTLVKIDDTTEPNVVPEYLTMKTSDVKITVI